MEMNKDQAAKFLGVSVRTLQRHTSAGKIAAKYIHSKLGKVAEYDKPELERFKAELEKVTAYVRPHVTPDTPVAPSEESTALAPIQLPLFEKLADAFEALKESLRPDDKHLPVTDLAAKLILTLSEAARLSGLSRGFLIEAIKSHKLQAQILGRGWKVKRADLEAFVKKL